jgi:hypothetical protein
MKHLPRYSKHILFPPQCTQLHTVKAGGQLVTGWTDKHGHIHVTKREPFIPTSETTYDRMLDETLKFLDAIT